MLIYSGIHGNRSPTQNSTNTRGSLNYYVSVAGSDSNNGTVAKPWRTINHAAASVRPGATVHVAAGKYEGSIVTSVNGTSDARIRFISDQRWAALIVGNVGEAVWQNRGDYVDISGFDVTGPNANGIENLGSNVRILGNQVHNIVAPCNSNGGSGINNANYVAHDNEIIGNFVHDVHGISGCEARHGVGIYHSNRGGQISNNIACHNDTVGIQLWHAATAVVVANNTVVGNGVNGIVIGAGDAPGDVTNDYSLVVNNISINNRFYGIQEFGKTGSHNRYANNLVYGNPEGNLFLLTGKATGTITTDPQLVNPNGALSSDYKPRSSSPAIGAGVSQKVPAVDFEGGARPDGKAFDIGAFESGAMRPNGSRFKSVRSDPK